MDMNQANAIPNFEDRERDLGEQVMSVLTSMRELALRRQTPEQPEMEAEMEAEPTAPQQPEMQPAFDAADAALLESAVPPTPPNAPVAQPMQAESTAPAPAPSAAHPLSSTVGAAAEPQAAPEAASDVVDAPAPAVATVVEPFDPASLDPNDENYLEKLRAECRKRNIEFTSRMSSRDLLRKLTRPPPAPPPPRNWTCADCDQPESKC